MNPTEHAKLTAESLNRVIAEGMTFKFAERHYHFERAGSDGPLVLIHVRTEVKRREQTTVHHRVLLVNPGNFHLILQDSDLPD